MKEKNLPLRTGVGIAVLNENNKVFVGKRIDNPVDKWQMPQGGVDPGETFVSAMKRELSEETNIKNIKILKELDYWLEYELPPDLVGIIWRGKYRGQKQKWFIARFLGKDSEVNLKTKKPEFVDWKWLDVEELPNVIVDFKKDVYKKLLKELKNFIN
tara:strand:- start:734 stop:1204 length:471 start_codon:yes stop_codon:yes gene_type:complete